jgi:hypothetical protein
VTASNPDNASFDGRNLIRGSDVCDEMETRLGGSTAAGSCPAKWL